MSRSLRRTSVAFLAALTLLLPITTAAAPPANEVFQRIWERTERPVAERATSRTWMWGPEATTGALSEPYLEAPDGYRQVQYFDKTRMEINNPNADPESVWFVTNGLLAKELITGRIQLGHLKSIDVGSSSSQIAGDLHPDTPTYQTLSHLLAEPARETGVVITTRLNRDGDEPTLEEKPELGTYGVETSYYVPETDHTVAEPFWTFMTSSGLVFENGINVNGRLFQDPFFATGFPIAEAYWVHVPVAGEWQDVLLQCFERRCLTYTPDNSDGWQVEAGNIGQHYHQFRYGHAPIELDCIDLNVATTDDLVRITNIGEARARDIMATRPFESIEDLERVPGIGPATVERIVEQGLVCVEYDVSRHTGLYQAR